VDYSKRPFGGPEAVLAALYHRVAISNSRLRAYSGAGVAFKYKDYRVDGERAAKGVLSQILCVDDAALKHDVDYAASE